MTHENFPLLWYALCVLHTYRAEQLGLAHESPESIVVEHHRHIESWRFISIAVKCTVMTLIRNRHFSESVICRNGCTWAALTPTPKLDCMPIIRGYYLFMIWLLFWPANIVSRTYFVLFAACDGFMAFGTCVFRSHFLIEALPIRHLNNKCMT